RRSSARSRHPGRTRKGRCRCSFRPWTIRPISGASRSGGSSGAGCGWAIPSPCCRWARRDPWGTARTSRRAWSSCSGLRAWSGGQVGPWLGVVLGCAEGDLGGARERRGRRRASLLDMKSAGVGRLRMRFKLPARGLLGYRSEFLTDTRGTGIMHHRFFEYGPWAGPISGRSRGVMVADRQGVAVAFALFNLKERGTMFLKPGDPVYEGMVVGENSRTDDMDVNASKEKKLTNMRTTASDEMIILEPPRRI